jgi:cyanophycinase
VATIEAGLTDRIVGLDDATTLSIRDGALELLGPGSMWELVRADDGVLVRTSRASA